MYILKSAFDPKELMSLVYCDCYKVNLVQHTPMVHYLYSYVFSTKHELLFSKNRIGNSIIGCHNQMKGYFMKIQLLL